MNRDRLRPPTQPAEAPQRDAVLRLVLKGMRTRDIAAKLGINYYTAKDHVKRLYLIHGVHRRAELLAAHGAAVPRRLARRERSGGGGARPKRGRLTPLRQAPTPLAERRRAVALLLVAGVPSAQIAKILGLRADAVRSDVARIYTAFGVRSRRELAAKLIVRD